MKKLLVAVLLICLGVMGVACTTTPAQSGGSGSSGAGSGSAGSGSSSTASTAQAVQNTATVRLEGNPTTGYTWIYTAIPNDVIKEKSSDYIMDSNPQGMTGVGGTFVFEFEAVKEGSAQILFFYLRTWENEPAAIVEAYNAVVDAKGNLTITPVKDPVNNIQAITLEGNPTTGYTWVYTNIPDGIVSEKASDFLMDPHSEGLDGAGGTFLFVFESVGAGEAELVFYYKRSWEDTPPEDAVAYMAVVDNNGKLVISKVSE